MDQSSGLAKSVIASTTGTAYDLRLRRVISRAQILAYETQAAVLAAFSSGCASAVAGIRSSLEKIARHEPELRLVEDNFAVLGQAILIPRERPSAAKFVQQLIVELVKSQKLFD